MSVLSRYKIKFVFLILSIFFGTVTNVFANSKAEFECIRAQLLDATITCKSVTSTPVTPQSDKNNKKYSIVSLETCAQTSLTVGRKNYRCYEISDKNNKTYKLVQIIDPKKCPSRACDTGKNEYCTLLNPVGEIKNKGSGIWKCINSNVNSLNVFGVELGDPGVFIPRFVRLIFMMVLAFIGIRLFVELFTVIWSYTTNNEVSEIEKVQKRVINIFIGLLLIAMAVVIVQFFASVFGIGGNIFIFTYP